MRPEIAIAQMATHIQDEKSFEELFFWLELQPGPKIKKKNFLQGNLENLDVSKNKNSP